MADPLALIRMASREIARDLHGYCDQDMGPGIGALDANEIVTADCAWAPSGINTTAADAHPGTGSSASRRLIISSGLPLGPRGASEGQNIKGAASGHGLDGPRSGHEIGSYRVKAQAAHARSQAPWKEHSQ